MTCLLQYLPFFVFLIACTSPEEETISWDTKTVQLEEGFLDGLHKIVVKQTEDVVFKKEVDYEAYPLSEVLIKAFPGWKDLLAADAMLVMRASGGYAPQMPFSEGFSGRVFLATNIAGRGEENPYDCWMEGGKEHCDLGYFIIWTDGYYPERPQPWGTYELEVVQFEKAYADAIPHSEATAIAGGFELYRKYCIECHRVNFVGGSMGTEHVVREFPLDQEVLDNFVFQFRKNNPATFMPDFNDILTKTDTESILAYLDHMNQHQNICQKLPDDPRCIAQ